jgi:hypothetical protein
MKRAYVKKQEICVLVMATGGQKITIRKRWSTCQYYQILNIFVEKRGEGEILAILLLIQHTFRKNRQLSLKIVKNRQLSLKIVKNRQLSLKIVKNRRNA